MITMALNWFQALMPPPLIEEARVADATDMALIHSESFHKGWSRGEFEGLLRDPQVIAHVLRRRRDGPVAGFALSRFAVDEGELLSIALAPRLRGRGWSHILLTTHRRSLGRRHVARLFLEVAADNAPALRLYHHEGFREIGRRKGYYSDAQGRRDAIAMMLDVMP